MDGTDQRQRDLQQAQDVWFLLEQALDRMPAAHPAEILVRRAVEQAEIYWKELRAQSGPVVDQSDAAAER